MSYIESLDLNELKLYFAYKRQSTEIEPFRGTFHAHQGIEILIVHEGKGTLIVDQKSYEVTSGTLCLFQPYQLHHIQMEVTRQTPFIRSIIQFEPSLYEAYFEKWPSLAAFFRHIHTSKLPYPCLYQLEPSMQFHSLLQSMEHRLPALNKKDALEEYSLFLISFFREFKPLWEQKSKGQISKSVTRKPHQAERILAWLEGHYTEPLRLEKMAGELHLSPHHLSHLFKECTGSSISDYVIARRMQQAVKLLISTDQSVAYIGESVGMPNCSFFCKTFKKQLGVTPHQYRKQWQNQSVFTTTPDF
ncbi:MULTISPECIES: AraC family transcriptional regulator [unclassified Paenibacillus]|uniref:AraC family transcriptional regulator n=1 Tax=unclassified Paenibacillus TaxID=185978 RepID=UPI0009AD70F9|nr:MULTISPECIES: AraC family transcriptional regulator [unclassified Paenibacillus]MBE1440957.1 AraC-like DNA-binding protein [Paenibacillus sp. OAS669]